MELSQKAIKAATINRCLTVSQLAKNAGVSEMDIYRGMYHKAKPNTATIGKIAKALGGPAERLLKD